MYELIAVGTAYTLACLCFFFSGAFLDHPDKTGKWFYGKYGAFVWLFAVLMHAGFVFEVTATLSLDFSAPTPPSTQGNK